MHWVLMCSAGKSQKIIEAIDSALNQSLDDVKVLLIDDSGNAETNIQITSEDVLIKKNHINMGYTRSLNIGLNYLKEISKETQVETLCILDDDDVWIDKDKLRKQYNFLNTNQEFDIVASRCEVVNKANKIILNGDNQYHGPANKRNILDSNPIVHSSVMYRAKKVFEEQIRYDEDLIRSQDYGMWLNLILNKNISIMILPDITVSYLFDDGLIAKLKKKRNDLISAKILKERFPDLNQPSSILSYFLSKFLKK